MGAQRDRWGLPRAGEGFRLPRWPHRPLLMCDRVTLDGKLVRDQGKRYILLYKPKGYVTTYKDPDGRPTVYDLLDGVDQFVAQVGRLDLDTSGLLLLTNDSLLAEALTNPKRHVPKTYLVKASGQLTNDQLESLRRGVELDDGITRPAAVVHVRNCHQHLSRNHGHRGPQPPSPAYA